MIFMEYDVLLMNKTVKIDWTTPGLILFLGIYTRNLNHMTRSEQIFVAIAERIDHG